MDFGDKYVTIEDDLLHKQEAACDVGRMRSGCCYGGGPAPPTFGGGRHPLR